MEISCQTQIIGTIPSLFLPEEKIKMNRREKDTVKKCLGDIEAVYQKIYTGKPLDHYDEGKLSSVIGALRLLIH